MCTRMYVRRDSDIVTMQNSLTTYEAIYSEVAT